MVAHLLPTTPRARVVLLVAAAAWVIAGVAFGRGHAWNQSVGGMTAAFGGILFVLAGAALLVFGIVATVVGRAVGAPGGSVRRITLASLLALCVGFAVGYVTAASTGGTYRDPLVRQSAGVVTAAITSPTTTFVPRPDGEATCGSIPDGDAIQQVTALDLGELGEGTLRAFINFQTESTVALDMFIDGADSPDQIPPSWSGAGTVVSGSLGGRSATVQFANATVVTDPKLPAAPPAWSGPLSGTIGWTCAPWQ